MFFDFIRRTISHAAEIVCDSLRDFVLQDGLYSAVLANTDFSKTAVCGEIACTYFLKNIENLHLSDYQIHTISNKISSYCDDTFRQCVVCGNGFVNFKLSDKWFRSAADSISLSELFNVPSGHRKTIIAVAPTKKSDSYTFLRLKNFIRCFSELCRTVGHDVSVCYLTCGQTIPSGLDAVLLCGTSSEAKLLNVIYGKNVSGSIPKIVICGDCSFSEFISVCDFLNMPCSSYWLNSKKISAPLRLDTEQCLCENPQNPYFRINYMHKRLSAILARNSCFDLQNSEICPHERLLFLEIVRFRSVLEKSLCNADLYIIVTYMANLSKIFFDCCEYTQNFKSMSEYSLQLCFILKNLIEHIFLIFGINF